jgi:hypothetical protein
VELSELTLSLKDHALKVLYVSVFSSYFIVRLPFGFFSLCISHSSWCDREKGEGNQISDYLTPPASIQQAQEATPLSLGYSHITVPTAPLSPGSDQFFSYFSLMNKCSLTFPFSDCKALVENS